MISQSSNHKTPTNPDFLLKRAFEKFMAAKPWVLLRDHHILILSHPDDGSPFYAVAMGDGGQEFGISLNMGDDGLKDLAAIMAGVDDQSSLAPSLAAMAEYPPDHPMGRRPRVICHRIEPAATTPAFLIQATLGTPPRVTVSDKKALAHALDAATDLARTAGKIDSPVRPRTDNSKVHMVTTTLHQDGWHHRMEVHAVFQTA